MPYKVLISDTEENNKFLKNLPQEIIPKVFEQLKHLGEHPYLGRSVEAPLPAYIYSFQIAHTKQIHEFVVSYKINEGDEIIYITDFGITIIKTENL